ncbi:MAG: LytR family transcriptional regulator [Gaiellales bacterium]|nr:MAG: LytR family transcriptional regulator [Gaiellales bacterium]
MKKKNYTVKHSRARQRRAWGKPEPGFRASRLAESRRSRRRRRFVLIIAGGTILSIILFAAVFLLMRSRGDDAGPGGGGYGGDVNSVLVAIDDGAGRLTQLLLVAVGDDGSFRAVSMPARTVVEAPGHGFMTLAEVAAGGNKGLLDQAVADLLQHPVQYHLELDIAAVQLAAEQVGTMDINLRQAGALTVDGARVDLVAGANRAGSAQAVSWLMAAADDSVTGPALQAAFLQALRDAFLARSEADRAAFASQLYRRAQTDLDEDQFVSLFLGATSPEGRFGVAALPARPGGSGDQWFLEPSAVEAASLLGGDGQAGYTLEVRNGTEVAGVVEGVAESLAPLGIETTLVTETSGVNFEFTQIRYGSDAAREGNSVRDLLGAGTLIKDDYLEKNQIIVIIGLDIATARQGAR